MYAGVSGSDGRDGSHLVAGGEQGADSRNQQQQQLHGRTDQIASATRAAAWRE